MLKNTVLCRYNSRLEETRYIRGTQGRARSRKAHGVGNRAISKGIGRAMGPECRTREFFSSVMEEASEPRPEGIMSMGKMWYTSLEGSTFHRDEGGDRPIHHHPNSNWLLWVWWWIITI